MALTKIDDRGLKTPIDLLDNEKIRVGTGNDLEIYHTGSDSRIIHTTTGDLKIRGNSLKLETTDGQEYIRCTYDADVKLFFDNVVKFITTADGYRCDDNVKGTFGSSADFQIYHNGSNSYIDNSTGNLYIRSGGNAISLRAKDDEQSILCHANGAVELYYDNVKTFETVNHGAKILATEGQNAELYFHADEGDDDADKWKFVAFNNPAGTFDLYNYTSGGWEKNISCIGNGAVELYHDNVKKLETTTEGAQIKIATANTRLRVHSDTDSSPVAGIELMRGTNDTFGADAYTDWSILNSGANLVFSSANDGSTHARVTIDYEGDLWVGQTPITHHSNRSAFFHRAGGNYVSITGASNDACGIVFGDSVANTTANYESYIAHYNVNNSLYLYTDQGNKGLELEASGDVNVIDGNLVVASGHGIDFSANSHAGGMTSELLDDYEEGTFNLSPNLNNVSYTTQQFTYTKIGNVVHFSGRLSYSGASGVSDQLLGLPFLPNGIYVTSSFYVDSGLNIGSEDFFTVYTSPTASRMHMTTQSTATAYQMPGAADFYIAGFYKTNS